jgi:hypothetical protein
VHAALPVFTSMATLPNHPVSLQPSAASGSAAVQDDRLTVWAIAALAFMISSVLTEATHAVVALCTIAPLGMITSAGWSSAYGGSASEIAAPIANLAAAAIFWLVLRLFKAASLRTRLFLLLAFAFNAFTGTAYIGFLGLTDYGDWYSVLLGVTPWTSVRILLLVSGILAWCAAILALGSAISQSLQATRAQRRRVRRISLLAFISAVLIACVAAAVNRLGIQFVLLSDLPITIVAQVGLLLTPFALRRNISPAANPETITRSPMWIELSAVCALAFIAVLGRGIILTGKLQ